jgi:hypothetical protein
VNLLKAPVRLVHFPGVAVAVVAAALILALTATSGRLFLASAGDAAVVQELDRVGGVPTLALVMFGNRPSDVAEVQEAAESVASDQAPDLGPPVRTRSGPTMEATAGSRSTGVRLAARDGFGAHFAVLDRAGGDGAWLPDTAARSLGVRAGQTLRLGQPPGVGLRVAGVYRDLAAGGRPLDPFWSPLASAIYTLSVTREAPPPRSRRSRPPPATPSSSRRDWAGSPPPRRSAPPSAAPTPPWPP